MRFDSNRIEAAGATPLANINYFGPQLDRDVRWVLLLRGEVKFSVAVQDSDIGPFIRVEGIVPLTIAQLIFADPVGRAQIHASFIEGGDPAIYAKYLDSTGKVLVTPREWEHVSSLERSLDPGTRSMGDQLKRLISPRVNAAEEAASAFVHQYQIDSVEALGFFIRILREQGVID